MTVLTMPPPTASTAPDVDLPVARVAVDMSLAHLDRLFDYAVPADVAGLAAPGVRVRVRFAGRLVDGFVVERVAASEHAGRLAPLKVVSPEPVLTPEVGRLCRAVADRYAGTLSDVLRLAVPPRHARVETAPSALPADPLAPPEPQTWQRYDAGPGFLDALATGGAPRAVWRTLPGPHWPTEIAVAATATLASGRGVVIVVPDARDLARVDSALDATLGAGRHVSLAAELGPAERYRRWLAIRRGAVRCVVGTRAAMFAPVADLGLVVCWDDGDDLHKEPRAPYPQVRDVLVLRAHLAGAAALVGGFAPSVEAEQLAARGWARALGAGRAAVRAAAPRVVVAGADEALADDAAARSARLPTVAWQAARTALDAGAPVLVQVPRAGYQPALACDACRTRAVCGSCAGPLSRPARDAASPTCGWCGRPNTAWACAQCGGRRLRAISVGARRTAEELGRAFPGVPVRTSDREHVVAVVPDRPVLVVATPGAEPVAEGGYGAVLLLDGALLLARPDLRAGEEALRRWLAAAALARPASSGGSVVVMADSGLRTVQALVRWDPATFAAEDYNERAVLGFPPAVRMAAVEGAADAVTDLVAAAQLPKAVDALGPVAAGDGERLLLRVNHAAGAELAAALARGLAVRAAHKSPSPVRVELDPLVLV